MSLVRRSGPRVPRRRPASPHPGRTASSSSPRSRSSSSRSQSQHLVLLRDPTRPGPRRDAADRDHGSQDEARVRTPPAHDRVVAADQVAEAVRGLVRPELRDRSRGRRSSPRRDAKRTSQRQTTQQMDESQEHAAAAALAFLGYDVKITPIGARVHRSTPGRRRRRCSGATTSSSSADRRRSDAARSCARSLERHKVGEAVELTVRRGTSTVTVRTKTVGDPEDPTRPIIGVFLENVPSVEAAARRHDRIARHRRPVRRLDVRARHRRAPRLHRHDEVPDDRRHRRDLL